jgi:hypothetical protein
MQSTDTLRQRMANIHWLGGNVRTDLIDEYALHVYPLAWQQTAVPAETSQPETVDHRRSTESWFNAIDPSCGTSAS